MISFHLVIRKLYRLLHHLRAAGWGKGNNIISGRIFFMRSKDKKNHPCKTLEKSIPEVRLACSKVLRQDAMRDVPNTESMARAGRKTGRAVQGNTHSEIWWTKETTENS